MGKLLFKVNLTRCAQIAAPDFSSKSFGIKKEKLKRKYFQLNPPPESYC
jgi:hypothetical protein